MRRLRQLIDGWVDHPLFDYLILLVAVAIAVGIDPSSSIRPDNQGIWYQTLAGVSGVLLSLGTIVVTLILTVTPSDRFERVLAAVGPKLLRITTTSLGGLIVTTGGFAGLFLLDVRASHELRLGVATALVTLMATSSGRLWWMFRHILAALTSVGPSVATTGDSAWQRPAVQPSDYAVPSLIDASRVTPPAD